MMPFSPKPPMPSWTRPCGLSKSHEITLAGLRFRPSLSGALFAPDLGALLVADLHLEQGAALARRGIAVPPYDTGLTLSALEAVIAETVPKTLYFLGDSFHDATGHSLLDEATIIRIRRMAQAMQTVWISGNHDPGPKDNLPGQHVAEARIGPVTLRHEPSARLATPEIAGHLHPGAGITQRGHLVRGKCFVSDARRIILPAFGAYTGAMSVRAPAFEGLLEKERASVILLARESMYRFPFARVS
jgi:DNA ligase-associated metallophosphoesterase